MALTPSSHLSLAKEKCGEAMTSSSFTVKRMSLIMFPPVRMSGIDMSYNTPSCNPYART